MVNRINNLACLLITFSGIAQAGELYGSGELGFFRASGNSETENLNAAGSLGYYTQPWNHLFGITAYTASEDGEDNAEEYQLNLKSEYSLSEISYLFGNLEYERDEFGGVFERTSETFGYGRTLLDLERHKLVAEIGAGLRQIEFQDGEEENGAIGRGAGKYTWKISDNADFSEELLVESGGDNTLTESITTLKLRIIGNLAAKISYRIEHNSEVPDDQENTDTFLTFTLSYEFGDPEQAVSFRPKFALQ